ncbi:MAG: hypothetical protein HFH62_14700 [Lachnospiraceae bacterium]|nr:hypothetical protein [Lachnospiraceae bacterium]
MKDEKISIAHDKTMCKLAEKDLGRRLDFQTLRLGEQYIIYDVEKMVRIKEFHEYDSFSDLVAYAKVKVLSHQVKNYQKGIGQI